MPIVFFLNHGNSHENQALTDEFAEGKLVPRLHVRELTDEHRIWGESVDPQKTGD